MDKQLLKEIVKSTLFVSGEGVDINEFILHFDVSEKDMKSVIEQLKNELQGENGIHFITYNNKIQLSSNPEYADYVATVLNPIREKALSKVALETLSIIAYKQPITRLEIEEVRGVSSDYAVQVLLDHNLIEVVGRKDVIGKPLLFGTTDEFLKRFDLSDLMSLPSQEEVLERIKLVEEPKEKTDSLYYDYKLSDATEEDVPEFLQDESISLISSDN